MEITVGMKGIAEMLVEREDTAREVGSGDLLVFATPCMVALMEGAACEAIAEALSETQTTVGTALNIEHTAATPVGLEVRAEAEVTAVEGSGKHTSRRMERDVHQPQRRGCRWYPSRGEALARHTVCPRGLQPWLPEG